MRATITLAVTAVALTACGSGSTAASREASGPAAPVVVTVTATPEAAHTPKAARHTPKPARHTTKASPMDMVALPDVVGMNLQKGQDTMQAAGFYFVDDQDATGRHRFQIWDRDWVVTRQVPPAGRRVSLSTKVVLWAKKYGE